MTATRHIVRDHGFEPIESTIPAELTIAEYRNRRSGEPPPVRALRRNPKLRLRSLIRR